MAGPTDPQAPGTEPEELLEDDDLDEIVEVEEDEAEPEPEEAEEPPPQAAQPRRSRSNDAIRNLRARAQQAEVERDFYRNQATRPQQPVDPNQLAQQRQQEYDRISMLPPNEQVAALHGLMQRENAITQLQMFDLNDRRDFESLKASFPAAQRLSGQVEQILQTQRAQGIYQFSRSQIFDALYGNEVRTRGTRSQGARARNGEQRVARETVRPGGRRGDVGGGSRRGRTQQEADIALLQNTRIDEL